MTLDDFLSKEQQEQVVSAIAAAELLTSGEIRVHVTPRCSGDVVRAAAHAFDRLKMCRTRHRNGVLIYIAFESRKLAILGDVGIDRNVAFNYWTDELKLLADYLRDGDVATGLRTVITRIGNKLAEFFPHEEDDINELPNEISYED